MVGLKRQSTDKQLTVTLTTYLGHFVRFKDCVQQEPYYQTSDAEFCMQWHAHILNLTPVLVLVRPNLATVSTPDRLKNVQNMQKK